MIVKIELFGRLVRYDKAIVEHWGAGVLALLWCDITDNCSMAFFSVWDCGLFEFFSVAEAAGISLPAVCFQSKHAWLLEFVVSIVLLALWY